MPKRAWKAAIPLLFFFLILVLPPHVFALPGLTVLEQRVIALFFLAALCWILEPIPIYATSFMVIVMELLMLSDKGFAPFMAGKGTEEFGAVLSSTAIMATLASPVIMLLMGGFFLAMAATKYRLDINLARVLLRPFGQKPSLLLLGLMAITAIFSMFMSNTATTAMMLAIITPVLACLEEGDPGRIAFVLAVPVGANIGGIGTPIGTPPNAIGLKYLMDIRAFSFAEWMIFALPYVLVLLLIAWWLLCFFFPARQKSLVLDIRGRFMSGWRPVVVYATFALTIALWMLGGLHGMDSNVVAMIPVAIFCCTGVVTKEDLKTVSWDVLWLVSGGIALGFGMEKTGLLQRLVTSIPFESFPPIMVMVSAMFVTLAMANFMSHTATANLIMPLMAVLAGALAGLESFGGGAGLILAVTFSASLGMSLPISAPPNALASATGLVQTGHMARIGVLVGLIGLALTVVMLRIMSAAGMI